MEKFPSSKIGSLKPEVSLLEEFAIDAGIDVTTIPKAGTVAYARLWDTCKEYSKEVHLEMVGKETDPSESQSRRRRLHNELCTMIFGIDHASVAKRDYKNLKRIANLAHFVSGREQYIEEV